ncbi:hypothetical protein [Streptomyces sp. CB01580]|uniref:hypothetical protein n=1 Tax=Streptomyces sp. CB01580 TaxID=1703933 RepID=UPI00093BA755|nr:hypothetical protein [Streptomyces sp. CB01580]OKJ44983.1 hypothetical protein AMK22_01305 [Streptomyces sp. CB01580]
MSTSMDHLVGDAEGKSIAVAGEGAKCFDVKSMPMSVNGLSAELLEEPAAPAAEKTAQGGLKPPRRAASPLRSRPLSQCPCPGMSRAS